MALESGTKGHEELSRDAVSVTPKEFEQALAKNKHVLLQESRFETTVNGAHIVGVPDLVDFRARRCLLILEFKFSARPNPFIDRYVQAQLYGWLLQRNGYDVTRLDCAVCVVRPVWTANSGISKLQTLTELGFLEEVAAVCITARKKMKQHPMAKRDPLTIEEDAWTLHFYRYEEAAAEKSMRWALGYWLGNREPVPTKNPSKCRKCAFNAAGVCSSALDTPDAEFRVRRRKGHLVN